MYAPRENRQMHTSLKLMLADEALQISDWAIEKARALDSRERWLACYWRITRARAALRLEVARRALGKQLIAL